MTATYRDPDEEPRRRADHVDTCPTTGDPCGYGCVLTWCSLRGSFDPPRPEPVLPEPRAGWVPRLVARLRSTVQNRAHEEPS